MKTIEAVQVVEATPIWWSWSVVILLSVLLAALSFVGRRDEAVWPELLGVMTSAAGLSAVGRFAVAGTDGGGWAAFVAAVWGAVLSLAVIARLHRRLDRWDVITGHRSGSVTVAIRQVAPVVWGVAAVVATMVLGDGRRGQSVVAMGAVTVVWWVWTGQWDVWIRTRVENVVIAEQYVTELPADPEDSLVPVRVEVKR